MARTKKTINFEQSLQALETLIEQMESGDLSLEDSLATFETGVKLTRECQTALATAEQKVQLLLAENDTFKTVPFTLDKTDNDTLEVE